MKISPPIHMVRTGSPVPRVLAGLIAAQFAMQPARALNTVNQFTGGADTSLYVTANWSLALLPSITHDAVFAATSGIRRLTAHDLTVGSFNVTAGAGTYTIRNETTSATHSNLTMGGAANLGNSVVGTIPADLLYAASGSTFNLTGPNAGGGTGQLMLILGQSGNFNIAGASTISANISDNGNLFAIHKTGNGTLTLTGTNSFGGGLTLAAGTLKLGNPAALGATTGIFTISGGTLDSTSANLALTTHNPHSWNADFTFTGSNNLDLGDGSVNLGATGSAAARIITTTANTLTVSGVIANGSNGTTTGLTKSGGGTLILAGGNTFTGNTTVNAGALILATNAALAFVIGDSSNNSLEGSGTVVLNGRFTIDTSAVTISSGTWLLVNVTGLNETFGSTFSVEGFSPNTDGGIWSRTAGNQTWTFTKTTGTLVLTSAAPTAYETWATTTHGLNGAAAAFDADCDHDGIANGLEWIFGCDPTCYDSPTLLPAITGNATTGLTLVFSRDPSSIAEITLMLEWGDTPGTFSNSLIIGTTDINVPPADNKPSVHMNSPESGKVTVIIPPANAVSGRLFARLKATRK